MNDHLSKVGDAIGQSVTRYNAEWAGPQRLPVGQASAGEVTTEESDRYFNAYVTTSFHLGDGGTPVTYVLSIFPIARGAAAPSSARPMLRSDGTCVSVSGLR